MSLWSQIRKLPRSVQFAILVLILLLIYLCIAKIDIVSPGTGIITGSEDKIDIISPGSGFINKFDLKSGSEVHKGDILFSYTNLDSFYKEKSLRDLVDFSKNKIAEIEADLTLLNFLRDYEFLYNVPGSPGQKNAENSQQKDSQQTDHKTDNVATVNVAQTTVTKDNNVTADTASHDSDNTQDNEKDAEAADADTDQPDALASLEEKFISNSATESVNAFKYYQEYKSLFLERINLHHRKQEITNGIAELTTQISMLNNKAQLLRSSGAPQVDIINAKTDISKTRSQIIQERISLLSLENDMLRSRRDFDSRLLSSIYDEEQQLSRLRKEQIENTGELELLKNKILSNSVEAPVDGVILDIVKNFAAGSYVEQSQLIMKLKKKQVSKVVEARFDAKYRPFIFPDGEVKVVINTPGYKKYFTGHIIKISPDSFTDDEKHLSARYYKVEIKVDNDTFNLNNDSEGIQVNVYAISKRMTVISYLTALVNSNIVFNVW